MGITKDDIAGQSKQKLKIKKLVEAKQILGNSILPNKNVRKEKPFISKKPNFSENKGDTFEISGYKKSNPERNSHETKSKLDRAVSLDDNSTPSNGTDVTDEQIKMSQSLVHSYVNTSLPGGITGAPAKLLPNVPSAAPQKNLPPVPNEYSYAAVEYRPMDVNGDSVVSTPINDKSKLSNDTQGNYCYAPVTPRPLVVGVDNAVSIPVPQDKPSDSVNNDLDTDDGDILHTEINGDIYAVVEKPPKYTGPKAPSPKQKPTTQQQKVPTVRRSSVYDTVADPVINNKPVNLSELYAPVDFNQKRRLSEDITASHATMNNNNVLFPPGFNPSARRVSDGMLNTPYFPNAAGRKPPPIPKPYGAGKGPQLSPHIEERLDPNNRATRSTGDVASSGGYAEVTLDQTKRHQKSTLVHSYSSDLDPRHSQSDDRLSKSHNTEQLSGIRQYRTHRRMKSTENVAIFNRSFDSVKDASSGHSSALSDKSSRMSNSSSSISKDSEDGVFPARINGTMTDYVSRVGDDQTSDELPDGWQEVKDADGVETYFWHIWTGTIQYERPSLLMTPTSSSRSVSPFSGLDSTNNSRAPSVSDPIDDKNFKLISSPSPRPETPDTKAKQIISFPVHSMGWMEVGEDLMGPKVIGETVNSCISTLAKLRNDLHKTEETWAEGADLKLILEGETLKLVNPDTKHVYHKQPIAKMRVWGVGREGEEKRDFAYIARDPVTQKHKCHMFRCHGHVSGRSVTNALQAICTRVLDEKRKAKERESPVVKPTSDLMRPPSKASGSNFNERSYPDQKKCFTAKYVGSSEVAKSSGVDVLNKAVQRLSAGETSSDWPSVLLEVTTSEIKTIDCIKQQATHEHRVRFITFLGVAQDERFGAYIVAVSKDTFVCHVYFCAPHAGTLTKAIEEACKLRFEKMLDSQVLKREPSPSNEPPLKLQPVPTPHNQQQQQIINPQRGSMKEKTTKLLTSTLTGVFSKFNKKDTRRKEDETPPNSRPSSFIPGPNEHVVRYFGAIAVNIGTGREPVENAVKQLSHGDAMFGYLEIEQDCLTLSDGQRSAISQRIFDVSNISYCGMTSDRKFFGVIISRGKGKYMCHVFTEYQANTGVDIVDAIQNVL